ncbi:Prosolanapyrone synthase [Metarhizium brunneum]|uniref:Prosolanapyrone synthase n=1 Tax=Metarhizium brunneum TaxID=500148 RepID=A0A7D5UWM5_9HYPO
MGKYARSPAGAIAQVPDGKSLIHAASMLLSYTTSIYALHHLGRLRKGETVLIQSASGGLGIAAIYIAQYLGADIFATAGTEKNREMLVEEFGLSPTHVFGSRDAAAVKRVMQATKPNGIDVILGSALGGDSLQEQWTCIAPQVRFINVSRFNALESSILALDVFKRNATFSSFDIDLLYRQTLSLIARYSSPLFSDRHVKVVR